MDTPPPGSDLSVDSLGVTDNRSDGHDGADNMTFGVRQPVSGSLSLCCRHHDLHMDSHGHVCLSSMGNVEQGPQQTAQGGLYGDSDCIPLAKQGLFSSVLLSILINFLVQLPLRPDLISMPHNEIPHGMIHSLDNNKNKILITLHVSEGSHRHYNIKVPN